MLVIGTVTGTIIAQKRERVERTLIFEIKLSVKEKNLKKE